MKKIIFRCLFLMICVSMIGCSFNIENDNQKINDTIIEYDSDKLKLDDYQFEVKEDNSKQQYKILVIDIDPLLTKGTIEGVSCKGKTASECLKQNKKQAINELIEDLNDSSHNFLDVQIEKTEFINEFATFKKEVTLLNGQKAYKFDEDTWLDIFKNGWYNGIMDKRIQDIGNWFGTFDYEYIIDKLNLVERRNNNEFDEVWIVNEDPVLTYESIMVGRNAFWINGTPIEKKCKPFKMINVSISRPDSNFECFGHASEQLLNNVFLATNYENYDALNWKKDSTTIDESNYDKLNLFQKFMLTNDQNTNKNSGYTGVGNMHYSPNSVRDYDWDNKNKSILSKANEWNNYPNITNDKSTSKFDIGVYMNKKINGTNSNARLHHRWWFGLFPHHTGYTKDGYYNNWWKYYMTNTYVDRISFDNKTQTFNVGDKISVELIVEYKNGENERINVTQYDKNIEIDNKDLFYVDSDGYLYARKHGESLFKYYRDGISEEINIIVN